MPSPPVAAPSAAPAMLVGMAGLAAAMGIGRFAFTPLLPLMQAHDGLTLAAGAWLAASNYAGYLAGALACVALHPAPRASVRLGLLAVALATAAMALTDSPPAWALWRFVAGVASAFVLVGVSAWSLGVLAGRPGSAGGVFAGVGIGIALTGLVGLAAGVAGVAPDAVWLGLGALAAVAAWVTWRPLGVPVAAPVDGGARRHAPLGARAWWLIVAYGAFGFGYIIPATFLPAMARHLVPDPALFGWIWPVFGAAAAVSTVLAARWLGSWPPRRVWAGAQLAMAVGVVAPAVAPQLGALLLAALVIGGTFMVLTMAAMQEARRLGAGGGARLMAGMTAAFAAGQLAGPLTVGAAASATAAALTWPSVIAAAVLVAGAATLGIAARPARTAAPLTWREDT